MATTTNLSTLKIHKLTQAQYDREVENGTIDENALYLTPDEEIDLSLYMTKTNPVGNGSFSMNRKAGTTVGNYSFAEGENTIAAGDDSHAEGYFTTASGVVSHAEGNNTTASGIVSHAEGYSTTASGQRSHAEGFGTIAAGDDSHAEGYLTTASGNYSHAEGESSVASGIASHAEGGETTASGDYSHAEGYMSQAEGADSHAEGLYTVASGDNSHAAGCRTTALANQYVIGHYNGSSTAGSSSGTTGDAFIIGKGTGSSKSNAMRVTYAGKVYSCSTFGTSGADYAEFFEWADGNPNAEDRRGYFVTLDGENIKIAKPNDYILGIISGMPCVLGNSDEDWRGRYILDDFGAFITEEFEYKDEVREEVIDKETGETTFETRIVTKIGTRYKENPDYDSTLPYIQREDRPEWDAVGMIGVLSVRDDGTCQVNGFCKIAEGGIATASDTGYRVIKRVNENIVKVVFR